MIKKLLLSMIFVPSFLFATREPSADQKRMEPLIAAIQRGDVAAVQAFIYCRPACVYWRDDLDNTPLHYAAVYCVQYGLRCGEGLVRALFLGGANLKASNDCGQRPTDWIKLHVNGGVVTILLKPQTSTIPQEPQKRYLVG